MYLLARTVDVTASRHVTGFEWSRETVPPLTAPLAVDPLSENVLAPVTVICHEPFAAELPKILTRCVDVSPCAAVVVTTIGVVLLTLVMASDSVPQLSMTSAIYVLRARSMYCHSRFGRLPTIDSTATLAGESVPTAPPPISLMKSSVPVPDELQTM